VWFLERHVLECSFGVLPPSYYQDNDITMIFSPRPSTRGGERGAQFPRHLFSRVLVPIPEARAISSCFVCILKGDTMGHLGRQRPAAGEINIVSGTEKELKMWVTYPEKDLRVSMVPFFPTSHGCGPRVFVSVYSLVVFLVKAHNSLTLGGLPIGCQQGGHTRGRDWLYDCRRTRGSARVLVFFRLQHQVMFFPDGSTSPCEFVFLKKIGIRTRGPIRGGSWGVVAGGRKGEGEELWRVPVGRSCDRAAAELSRLRD